MLRDLNLKLLTHRHSYQKIYDNSKLKGFVGGDDTLYSWWFFSFFSNSFLLMQQPATRISRENFNFLQFHEKNIMTLLYGEPNESRWKRFHLTEKKMKVQSAVERVFWFGLLECFHIFRLKKLCDDIATNFVSFMIFRKSWLASREPRFESRKLVQLCSHRLEKDLIAISLHQVGSRNFNWLTTRVEIVAT